MTATVFNTKTREVENKILDCAKCITIQQFNKLTGEKFKERLKQTDLVSKNGFDNKLMSFNKRITSKKIKYLEVHQKINSLTTKNYNVFSGRIYFTNDDGSQNMFVYEPTVDTLECKGTDYVLSWKSKKVYTSKLKPLYTALFPSIKISGYRMGKTIDKEPLGVQQNNYATKL